MKFILSAFLFMVSLPALSYTCECRVEFYPPLTGSHSIPIESKIFEEGREFGKINKYSYQACYEDCKNAAVEKFPYTQLQQVAYQQSVKLIQNDQVGYNCTGPTTFKYPVRFKAFLGPVSLGNVRQEMIIVHHDQKCFY